MSDVVDISNVTITRGKKTILDQLSWQVQAGQHWIIMGPNGAGKTTLVSLCMGFIYPSFGQAIILGETLGRTNVRELRTRIGVSSAATAALLPPEETVFNSVLTAAYAVTGRWNEIYDAIDIDRATSMLEKWGLTDLANRTFGTLSEGERKRVLIARALMSDPEILILDEPAAGLDVAGREDLIKRLRNLALDPYAPVILLITHHVEEIPPGFEQAMLLRDGQVFASGRTTDVIGSENLSAAFDARLAVEKVGERYFAFGYEPSKARRARN
jgi:iron complex transport system ATP-binding protein